MRIKRLLKFIDITDSIKLCPTLMLLLLFAALEQLVFAPALFFFSCCRFFAFQLPFQRYIFFMLYFVSDVAMAANFPCRQWQRPMTGSKIGNAKSSNDDGDSDVSCDGSSSSSSSSNSD